MTFIPADTKLRPLRDQMIVEPLEVVHSRYLIIPEHGKPIRGTCRAIGPGHYRKQYDHPDKHKRTKMWEGTHYVPTEVKVGDIVHLGGAELGGYAFEQFWWGDKLHIHCREADVAGIEC
jgi:co-chaperonin GroES (HSP10)